MAHEGLSPEVESNGNIYSLHINGASFPDWMLSESLCHLFLWQLEAGTSTWLTILWGGSSSFHVAHRRPQWLIIASWGTQGITKKLFGHCISVTTSHYVKVSSFFGTNTIKPKDSSFTVLSQIKKSGKSIEETRTCKYLTNNWHNYQNSCQFLLI